VGRCPASSTSSGQEQAAINVSAADRGEYRQAARIPAEAIGGHWRGFPWRRKQAIRKTSGRPTLTRQRFRGITTICRKSHSSSAYDVNVRPNRQRRPTACRHQIRRAPGWRAPFAGSDRGPFNVKLCQSKGSARMTERRFPPPRL
jgi:hypothetical protein